MNIMEGLFISISMHLNVKSLLLFIYQYQTIKLKSIYKELHLTTHKITQTRYNPFPRFECGIMLALYWTRHEGVYSYMEDQITSLNAWYTCRR